MKAPKNSDVYFGIDRPVLGKNTNNDASHPLMVHVFQPLYPDEIPYAPGTDDFNSK